MSDSDEYSGHPPKQTTISVDSLPLPIIVVLDDRSILSANKAARQLYGEPRIGNDVATLIRHPNFLQACDKAIASKAPASCEISKSGVSRRSFEVIFNPTVINEKSGTCIVLHDITATQQAELFRSSFVADVSHELRSPLTTLIATLETLQGKAGDDKKTRDRFVKLIAHETDRMHRIVNDLLSLSATEANEHLMPEQLVELAPKIRMIAKVFDEVAKKKKMTFDIIMDEDLSPIRGDRDAIYKVFHNLIDNAVKYGAADSVITIVLKNVGKKIIFTINNKGSYIPEQHLSRLTERFYRVDKSRSRELGGTGLGLAIVKHIVNRHHGTMQIASDKREGTTFSVKFPIAEASD